MRVSKAGIALVKHFEGLYLTAYKDAVGVLTIGYGITDADAEITGHKIHPGMQISEATANKWLEDSLNKKYLPLVLKYQKKYQFNSSQVDALVSFAFNIGSIDQLTSKGRRSIKTIEEKILEYNKAGGKELKGLTRRRKAELELFRQGEKGFDEGYPKLPARGYFVRGDKGAQVMAAQRLLAWADYYTGEIDGIYGEKTEKAVKALQKAIKTTQNGKFGNKCLPYLKGLKK